MKRLKRPYIPPLCRTIGFAAEPLLGSSDETKRGYAIDNDEHSNDKIIEVFKPSDMNYWDDKDLD